MTTPDTGAPRSLAEALRSTGDAELAGLLTARPDLASPVPTDTGQLAARAATRASVTRALDRLDRFALDVLDAVAVSESLGGGPVTVPAVAGLLGMEPDAVGPVVDRLRTLALLWGPAEELRLVRTVREVIGAHPAGLGPPARQALLAHSPGRLARIVTDLGMRPSGDPVTDATIVGELFGDPRQLDRLLEQLAPQARAALDSLKAGPPTGRIEEARRDVDVAGARTPVDQLLARGLLVPVESGTVLLPGEVGLHLRSGLLVPPRPSPPVPDVRMVDATRVDQTAGGSAYDLVRRVRALLESWAESPPPVLRAGGLGVRDLRRAATTLDVGEATAALTAELAYLTALVGPSVDIDEVWLPTPEFDAWSALEPAEQWATLVTAWLGSTRVAALVGTRDDRDRVAAAFGPDVDRPTAPELRRLTLGVLADFPPGGAPAADDVLDVVRWLRPRRSGRQREDVVRWTLSEAESLGVTGAGALSAPGRALLAGGGAAATMARLLPEPLDHVLIQADLTAVAPGPLLPALARDLALLAEVESTGGATVYRFSADSVRRGLDAGRTAAELHRFLASVSRTPVPQPLVYLVDDVARRHGLLRIGSAASFVRCDDKAVLTEILADRRAAGLSLRRLAPTVLSSQSPPTDLLERLRAMGYAPAAEGVDGSVLVARPAARRAPERSRPVAGVSTDRIAVSARMVDATVRALRAGDRTAAQRPTEVTAGPLGQLTPTQTLSVLRSSLESGDSVWIGYVDNHGATSERVVDPVRIEGGWLTAYDHRSEEVRSFAVHRISGISPVPAA